MARRLHETVALAWLALTNQRESRNEAECNFRQWIQRQTRRGASLERVRAVLEHALRVEHTPCWRFSRELLEDVGDLPTEAEPDVPPETEDQRARRKAATAAFLRRRPYPADELSADRAEAEAELEDVGRLSPVELERLEAAQRELDSRREAAQRELDSRREGRGA